MNTLAFIAFLILVSLVLNGSEDRKRFPFLSRQALASHIYMYVIWCVSKFVRDFSEALGAISRSEIAYVLATRRESANIAGLGLLLRTDAENKFILKQRNEA